MVSLALIDCGPLRALVLYVFGVLKEPFFIKSGKISYNTFLAHKLGTPWGATEWREIAEPSGRDGERGSGRGFVLFRGLYHQWRGEGGGKLFRRQWKGVRVAGMRGGNGNA